LARWAPLAGAGQRVESASCAADAPPPARRAGKDHLKSIVTALGALFLTVLAVEVPAVVGWVDYRYSIGFAERSAAPKPKPYPIHTEVHEKARGDLISFYGLPTETRDIVFRTDQHGFRNPSDRARAALVVIGDSFVVNPVIAEPDLFTTVLGRRLGVSVANIAHSGWGPYHELDALRRVGLPLQPRVALWVFYEGNDLADTLTYSGGEVGWRDRLFLSSAYLRLAALAERVLYGETRRNYSWPAGAPPFGSCRLRCGAPPCERTYFGNLTGALSLFEEVAVQRVERLLAEAGAAARARGTTFALVFAPVKLRVYREVCDFDEDNAARRSISNDLPERMQQWARARGIGFVDLTPSLRAAAARGEQVYFPDDTHWNARGNLVVGEALASAPAIVQALGGGGR
jgi:hypothetical protein